MRILNFLRKLYATNYNNIIKQQVFGNLRSIKSPIYFTGILSGLYLAGSLIADKPSFIKLSNVVMAESSENKTRKTTTLNFLADAVEIAAPAVVHVDVVSKQKRYFQETNSSGSGFIVTENGIVLTNGHVVGNATKVNVRMSSGETYNGSVIDVDMETDLAAIKLDNKSNVCL